MRILLASLLAAVVLFVWGFFFWGLSPLSQGVLKTLPNQDEIVPVLTANVSKTGVYMIPMGADADPNDESLARRHEAGPIATLIYQVEGAEMMPLKVMVYGFLHMFLSALIMSVIVATAGRRTFFGRFMLVLWIGVFVAALTEPTNAIWFYFPKTYMWLKMAYYFGSCIILAFIIGGIVTPAADPQTD